MASTKTVIVLGGGIGGIVVASELRKKLSREHKIVLIERERAPVFTLASLAHDRSARGQLNRAADR
jgi:NADH dehydrogenase FAD-containing subunit